jgi:hypothetical protein
MGVRVPQNIITTSKYTSGKEYLLEETYEEYIGYYYEIGDKTFVGKEFNIEAPLLIKVNTIDINFRNLLGKVSLEILKRLIGTNVLARNSELNSIPLNTSQSKIIFFAKKLNTNPVKIICISEEEYNNNKGVNKLYSYTAVQCNGEFGFSISQQNKIDIPEIEEYLKEYSNNPEG